MQDWREQARKNSLNIIDHGRCQLCGSKIGNGIEECVEIASSITHNLTHEKGIKHMTIFLCVDAHALQHAEIHGRWNNHFHLSRLHLILKESVKWNYKLSPKLSEVVDSYKILHLDETVAAPGVCNRGSLTVADVNNSTSDKEYIELVQKWASEVYNSFFQGHQIAITISKLFIKKMF